MNTQKALTLQSERFGDNSLAVLQPAYQPSSLVPPFSREEAIIFCICHCPDFSQDLLGQIGR